LRPSKEEFLALPKRERKDICLHVARRTDRQRRFTHKVPIDFVLADKLPH